MLLYSTRTAVFRNEEKSTLLCKITLPCGAEDEKLDGIIAEYYQAIYEETYASARAYAARISPPDNRLATFTVACEHGIKKGVLTVKRSYKISYCGSKVKEREFTDKFSKNMIKQRNIP